MMKYIFVYIILIIGFFSCKEQNEKINAIARVYDSFLYENDIAKIFPDNLSKEDSILFRNSFINSWAIEQLLLQKAKINIEDKNDEIKNLVTKYKKDLLIDKYKKAVLQQDLDTVITENNIDEYYQANKNIYKLNEDLIQLRYIHFNKDLKNEKEVIKLFKSSDEEDIKILIDKELEFNSFNFNDSIWISYNAVLKKLPILKDKGVLKKNKFIQKEDSLGVYLVVVNDVLYRNQIAPKSYVVSTIKQMILHKRKLELLKKIEQTLVKDAINKKQFEQY